MKDSRMDPVPGAPLPVPGTEQWWSTCEQPGAGAYPLMVLTPVPESPAPRDPWPGGVHVVVTGIAVLVITAELGRRAGVPAPVTAVCTAAGLAVVVVPRLVSAVPRPRLRPPAFAVAAH